MDTHDPQAAPRRSRVSPRFVMGLAVMAFGLFLTLDNLGVIDILNPWRFWPVILMMIGLSKFVQGGDGVETLLWVGAGGVLLAANLGMVQARQLWPLAMIVVGGRLILGALRKDYSAGLFGVSRDKAGEDPDRIDAFAMMGGVVRGTNSTAFRGGAATAFMGGCEIDLRQARAQGGPAVFDVFAFWGGVEIKVPEDWAVENRGTGILGAFVDSTRRPLQSKGTLVLTGLALMGGVEVRN